MTKLAEETARLVDALPPDKAQAVLDYARSLAEQADEDAWERRFADPRYAAKLEARLAEVEQEIEEGKVELLELKHLG